MSKNILYVNWKVFNGAATNKKTLKLRDVSGIFKCPVEKCLHCGFRSQRGLRKHTNNRHAWFYYFDEEPSVKREDIDKGEIVKLKQPTHTIPAFSIEDGVGNLFLRWLCTPCGGGKQITQAKQIAKRAMKFLMASIGESVGETLVTEEYLDCCLGSPSLVINFMQQVTGDWGLSSSAVVNYLKSMTDLLDFRKASGVTDCFTLICRYRSLFKKRKRQPKPRKEHGV